ncbi:MAG TPA: alpha-amylase family glycosyl hydrolase [Candidatus Saccharimonadales bacterium]|nr:alpha-amylase family glycosyl hydrolase [Candidatus Saccharimonadales bacterium]
MSNTQWWQTGIIYQIYVRSFCDSNGDGIGDLQGVISKLDYLKDLGVAGIWLSPITVSANADWGYDVVDYYSIDPHLGSMADFDQLIAETAKRGIKVLIDMVPNHTSIHHPWFQSALIGRDSEYRDYYIWADPKPGGGPPSNWRSMFGGSAWSYHRPTHQYFLHNFLPEQADLNWRNPMVKAEFDRIFKFWLGKGVCGFRIDVFNMLIKDQLFRDNPEANNDEGYEVKLLGQEPIYTTSRPELHRILRHWRQIVDKNGPGRLLLGETTMVYDMHQLAAFYGTHNELELAFNFAFLQSKFRARDLRRLVEETEAVIKSPDWPVWTGSNHDQPRFPSRWARADERKIRCGLLMLLTLRGTPVLYYGDEIGMEDTLVMPWRLQDSVGKRLWPLYTGRDKARTPMPWQSGPGAGFTSPDTKPWLPIGWAAHRNVEAQAAGSDSTLRFTRDVIAYRNQTADLQTGAYQSLPSPGRVWAYLRGSKTAVFINFSNLKITLDGVAGQVQLSTIRGEEGAQLLGELKLAPWHGVVVHLEGRPPSY